MGDTLGRLRATVAASDPPLWTRSFLLVCAVYLLTYGSYAAVHPTFAVYLETVTADESVVGLAFGAFTFAAMLARPATGWLLDRVGRRAVQAVAVVAFAAATLSFAWGAVVWVVVVLRVVHGAAWGVTSTTTPTIAADVVPAERRSEGFGYVGVLPNVALMALPPLALWVAHRFGFGAQFLGAALLALVALGPVALLGETSPAGGGSGDLYSRAAVPAALLVALAGLPLGAVDALVPLYASHVGLGNAGLFFTVMGGAIILARAVLGRLPGSTTLLLAASFGLQAAGLATLAFVPRLVVVRGLPGGLLAGAALFGAGFALVFPLLQSAAVAATGDGENGAVTATLLVGLDLGIGLGAVVGGVFAEVYSLSAIYSIYSSISVASIVIVVLVPVFYDS